MHSFGTFLDRKERVIHHQASCDALRAKLPVKVSKHRISLEIADFLSIWCVMEAFETSGAEKTWILARKGIIHSHPSEKKNSERQLTTPSHWMTQFAVN